MRALSNLDAATGAVRERLGGADAGALDLGARIGELDHAELIRFVGDLTALRKVTDLMLAVATAEVERRSDRSLGTDGLAQQTGHANATSLVQHITGTTRSEVSKHLRIGNDLAAADAPVPPADGDAVAPPPPWFAPLTTALTTGTITVDAMNAIRRGLDEPPYERYPDIEPDLLRETWRAAALRLLDEVEGQSIENLLQTARILRDTIDPRGVALRFEERYAHRGHSIRRQPDGHFRSIIDYDDEAAALVMAILSASLRPRRGPRFVESATPVGAGGAGAAGGAGVDEAAEEAARARAAAEADDRTTEQLEYDTLMAVLRTGAFADPQQAFGDRQPGVRIAITAEELQRTDTEGDLIGNGYVIDGGTALPGWVIERHLCDAGSRAIIFDSFGRPLDVEREHRLFTAKQRDALSLRDGGCMWPGCDAPASWTEAHHIDHWSEHNGKTNIDDGILLCRRCHLRLHNHRWRITRDQDGYLLHPPRDKAQLAGVLGGTSAHGNPRRRSGDGLAGSAVRGRDGDRDGLADSVAPGGGAGAGDGAGDGAGAGSAGSRRDGDDPPPPPIRLTTRSPRRFDDFGTRIRDALAPTGADAERGPASAA